MKLVLQRVAFAKVEVDGTVVGEVGKGILALVGVTHDDTREKALWLAGKLVHLRMFEDDQGKINRSLLDVQGGALIISQFTLYADSSEGRRPSFTKAAPPDIAKPLYEEFAREVAKLGLHVETGIFGADMKVSLLNDGPVTLILER